jgi:Kef-type K+ transport system membrane component KefB
MTFLPAWPLEANTMFFFGFLLFCGAMGGYLAHRVSWIPSITGFMLVGFLAGPNVFHFFTPAALERTRLVVDVALALILYRLGLSLDFKALLRDKALLVISAIESGATFALVYASLHWGMGISALTSGVIAGIAISSSPAVLIHVAHELGAHGPITQRAQALVALNNVWAFVAFAALLPALYRSHEAPLSTIIGSPVYQLLGSAMLGTVMGLALHHVARWTERAPQYNLALIVGAVTMTLGLAVTLNLSPLFAPLVLGGVVRSLERDGLIANMAFGPAFELFFVALFVYAGANLHIHEMITFAPAALVFVVARSVAKWGGVAAGGLWLGWRWRASSTAGLMLMPMAGMAIGLANSTALQFPQAGAVIASVVLAAVAIFETLGPPVVARALYWAREVEHDRDEVGWTVADAQHEEPVYDWTQGHEDSPAASPDAPTTAADVQARPDGSAPSSQARRTDSPPSGVGTAVGIGDTHTP